MINGIEWLVVTKMDVLDDLAEIPVCVGYKINGKKTTEIPAQISGYDKIEPIYETLPGWQKSTSGISSYDKLPQKAKDYLDFLAARKPARRSAWFPPVRTASRRCWSVISSQRLFLL